MRDDGIVSNDVMFALCNQIPAGIGIMEVCHNGLSTQTYLNDGYYNMLGISRDKRSCYLGASVLDAVHDGDRDDLMHIVGEASTNFTSFHLDIRIKKDDNLYKWFSIQGNPIKELDDRCVFYCVFSDVDELKLSQIKLQEQIKKQERQRILIDNTIGNLPGAVASFSIDSDGIHLNYISEGCFEITGYTSDEIISKSKNDVLFFTYEEDKEAIRCIALEHADNMEPFSHEFRVVKKNGGTNWVSLRLTPIVMDGILNYYGIYLNVTAEHEAAELQKKLVDHIPGGVIIYKATKEGIKTTYYSDGILRKCGYSREEYDKIAADDPVGGMVYEEDRERLRSRIAEVIPNNKPISFAYRIRHKNGTLIWTQISGTMIEEDDEGKIYYCIVTAPSEQAEIFRNIVENATNAVFIAERSNRELIYANKAWKMIRGIDPEVNVEGQKLYDVIPHDDIMYTDEELDALPRDRYQESYFMTTRGKYLDVWGRAIDWCGSDAYVCYITDETELWNSKQELQNLKDKIPGGISVYDIDDEGINLAYVNNAYYSIIGDKTIYVGNKTAEFIHDDDKHIVVDAVDDLRQGKDSIDIHFRAENQKGSGYVWIRLIAAVIKREGRKLTVYCCYNLFDEYMGAQQALISSRAMLDAAMNSAKIFAWKYDYRSHIITDTGLYSDKYDLPKSIENIPEALFANGFISPESREDMEELFASVPYCKKVQRDVKAYKIDSKKPFWQRIIITSVYDHDGNYIESIGTSIDVTEQKEREESYEEQIRSKHLHANNALAIAHINLSSNEITLSESDNSYLMNIMQSGSADEVLKNIRNNVSNDKDRENFDIVYNCASIINMYKKGQSHIAVRHHLSYSIDWMETSFDILTNPYSNDIEAILVLKNVQEMVIAEEVFNTLMRIDYESISTIDALTGEARPFTDGHLDDVIAVQKELSDNVAGVEKYLREHCEDNDVDRIILETSLPYVKKRLEKENSHMVTYSLRYTDRLIHKRVVYTYLDDSKRIILCAMQDMTETYRLEEQQKRRLAQALKDAEKANHAKTDFFSRMSHDMRTPMNGILGLARLSKDIDDIDILKRNMTKINESGGYLLSLINDTLDLQRIESGKLKLDIQVVHGALIVDNITDIISAASKTKNIRFIVNNDNINFDSYVRVDPVRIKQIFINILSNAVKFTPDGGCITLQMTCIGIEGMISHNRISISDTGIGMSEEFIKNGLFKAFSQEYNEVSSKYAGSGLGLSIVKSLVDMMGGKIEVDSKIGVGTTFTVYLDFEQVNGIEAQEMINQHIEEINSQKKSLEDKNILLVEDNELNAEIAMMLLENMGCKVTWVENGEIAVETYRNSYSCEYDAILMDIRMPVMNGLEATKAIRRIDRPDAVTIPIVAMTANAYAEDVNQSLAAGMNFHLAKPIDPDKLFKTLVRFICD